MDSDFVQNLKKVAFDSDLADVVLRAGLAGGQQANLSFVRILLAAQSPVFRNMFFGEMVESQPGAVVNCEFPVEVVKKALEYMCTGQVRACLRLVPFLLLVFALLTHTQRACLRWCRSCCSCLRC